MQKSGQEVYHLAFGQSPFPIPTCFAVALGEAAYRNEYLPVAGIRELREAISDFHLKWDNIKHDPEQIVVGTGSKDLIFLTMTIFNGDIILISPGWTTYAPQARLAGKTPIIIQTSMETEWKVTPQQIQRAIEDTGTNSNRLMVLNYPGNPSGSTYTKSELEALSIVCRKYNIVVLSDEIYGHLTFDGSHHSMAKVYPEGTLTTTGFSKWASAGGWRMGYIIVPKEMPDILHMLHSAASQTYSCAPAPMQYALAKGLQHVTELETYVKQERSILQAVARYCASELAAVGVKSCASTGGYYLMPDFEVCRSGMALDGITTCQQMCEAILAQYQVSLLPGSAFLRDPQELTVRLCYVDFDGQKAMECLDVVDMDFVAQCAPRVVEGISRLKQFVVRYSSA